MTPETRATRTRTVKAFRKKTGNERLSLTLFTHIKVVTWFYLSKSSGYALLYGVITGAFSGWFSSPDHPISPSCSISDSAFRIPKSCLKYFFCLDSPYAPCFSEGPAFLWMTPDRFGKNRLDEDSRPNPKFRIMN